MLLWHTHTHKTQAHKERDTHRHKHAERERGTGRRSGDECVCCVEHMSPLTRRAMRRFVTLSGWAD